LADNDAVQGRYDHTLTAMHNLFESKLYILGGYQKSESGKIKMQNSILMLEVMSKAKQTFYRISSSKSY